VWGIVGKTITVNDPLRLSAVKINHNHRRKDPDCRFTFFRKEISYDVKRPFFLKLLAASMIKLRLKRFGKKREVSYRIVAMHSTTRRDGRPLEELGFYNPRTDETRLNVPAIVKRLKEGAQPTETVRSILRKAQVFEQLKA